jgi:hypothetical protein
MLLEPAAARAAAAGRARARRGWERARRVALISLAGA